MTPRLKAAAGAPEKALREKVDALREQEKAKETDGVNWGYNSAIDDVLALIDTEQKAQAERLTYWWKTVVAIRNGMLTPKGYIKSDQSKTVEALDALSDSINEILLKSELSNTKTEPEESQ